jgi:hypothetical protein
VSHFTVLVVGEDVDGQLAPYTEHESEYSEFIDKTDEVEAEFDNTTEAIRLTDGTLKFTFDHEFDNPDRKVFDLDKDVPQYVYPEDSEKVTVTYREMYGDIEKFAKDYHGYTKEVDGRYGYYANPCAKWDWYEVGGRWSGYFKLKEGAEGERGEPGVFGTGRNEGPEYVDVARKMDIDVEGMQEDARKAAEERYDNAMKAVAAIARPVWSSWEECREKHGEDIDAARDEYNNHPYIKALKEATGYWEVDEFFQSKDVYLARAARGVLSTFAVLKDGKWYEKGKMGWFAIVANKKTPEDWDELFYQLWESIPDDTVVTLVDCHI